MDTNMATIEKTIEKLKRCPFCGAKRVDLRIHDDPTTNFYYVRCKCGVESPHKQDLNNLAEEWNRRGGVDFDLQHEQIGKKDVNKGKCKFTNSELLELYTDATRRSDDVDIMLITEIFRMRDMLDER